MKAREYAWEVLKQTYGNNSHTSELLRERPSELSDVDWNLAVKIIYGTLSNYRNLRYQWAEFLTGKLPNRIALIMDMALYQFIYLDRVPEYAVINESVELAKQDPHGNYAGLVNAILRNYLRRGYKEPVGNENEVIAITYSLPDWILALWQAHYGKEEALRLAKVSNQPKDLVYRVKDPQDLETILKEYPQVRKGLLADNALIIKEDPLNFIPYKKGLLAIQDEASQLVGQWVVEDPSKTILDLCAAPGTKSVQIAQLRPKSKVTAVDVVASRVELIKQAKEDNKLSNLYPLCEDGTKISQRFSLGSFDTVLVDAPCSGLGVLRDKPDLKIHVKPEDLDELVVTQKELLTEAAKMVKPNGYLIYSTCTLDKKENEKQIENLLKNTPEFKLVKQKTIFPEEYDTDGFYLAKLKKEVLQ